MKKIRVPSHIKAHIVSDQELPNVLAYMAEHGEVALNMGHIHRCRDTSHLDYYKTPGSGYSVLTWEAIPETYFDLDTELYESKLRGDLEAALKKAEAKAYLIRQMLKSDNLISYNPSKVVGDDLANDYPDEASRRMHDGGWAEVLKNEDDDHGIPF